MKTFLYYPGFFFLVFTCCSTAYLKKKKKKHFYRSAKRYKVLYPKGVKDTMSPTEATKAILEGIELDPEQYRLGNTKVYS